MRFTPGCNCCTPPPSCSLVVTVTGCQGAAVAGAMVTISLGGTTVATGATNSGGTFTGTLTSSGSGNYTVDVTGPTGYAGNSVNKSVTCPGTASVTVTLAAASGYVCACYCTDPLPEVIYLTCSAGTFAATYSPSAGPSGAGWAWSVDVTVANISTCYISEGGTAICCDSIGPGTITVNFYFYCNFYGLFEVWPDTCGCIGAHGGYCEGNFRGGCGAPNAVMGPFGAGGCTIPQTLSLPTMWFNPQCFAASDTVPISGTIVLSG